MWQPIVIILILASEPRAIELRGPPSVSLAECEQNLELIRFRVPFLMAAVDYDWHTASACVGPDGRRNET